MGKKVGRGVSLLPTMTDSFMQSVKGDGEEVGRGGRVCDGV